MADLIEKHFGSIERKEGQFKLMDSTLEKSFKLFFDFLCAISCVLIIPLFFSPVSETLVLVSKERLIFYAISYGLSFLFFGEVVGVRETNFQFGLGKVFFCQ